MPTINVSIDQTQLAQLRELLSPKQFKQATYQAVKRTKAKAERIAEKIFKGETYVKTKYINRRVFSRFVGDTAAEIVISGKGIPVIGFKTRVSKRRGVVVSYAPGWTQTLKHAFKARMQSAAQKEMGGEGHVGIGRRAVRGARAVHRLPIKEEFGPSLAHLAKKQNIALPMDDQIAAALQANILSQLDRFLS